MCVYGGVSCFEMRHTPPRVFIAIKRPGNEDRFHSQTGSAAAAVLKFSEISLCWKIEWWRNGAAVWMSSKYVRHTCSSIGSSVASVVCESVCEVAVAAAAVDVIRPDRKLISGIQSLCDFEMSFERWNCCVRRSLSGFCLQWKLITGCWLGVCEAQTSRLKGIRRQKCLLSDFACSASYMYP